MSERNLIILNDNKKVDKENSNEDDIGEEDDGKEAKYGFGISAYKLEKIMGKYKERGTVFKDLIYFRKQNGVSELLKSLLTNEKRGISSLEGREEIYGSNKVFVYLFGKPLKI